MPITGSTGPCVERMGTWGASDSHCRPIGSQPGLGVSGAEPAHADGTAEQSTNWRPSAVPVGRDGADTAGLAEGARRSDTRGDVCPISGTQDCD